MNEMWNMKKSLLFAIILLLISPLDVNANPFEKAFKELEKGLEDLSLLFSSALNLDAIKPALPLSSMQISQFFE